MKKKALFFAIALAVFGVSALGAETANAQSVYDNLIDSYSDPKGIDDDYYVQSSMLDVMEFTTRELADYLRGNDEYINGYTVNVDTMNSTTCDPSDWINAGNRLMADQFVSNQTDYYNGTSRLINSATFYTYNDVSNMELVFGSTLHAYNNRGVYRGGFINNGSEDTARISVWMSGTDLWIGCWNGAANTAFSWQGSAVPQGSQFVLGYLYDSWYPEDTASWNIYFLNHLPSGVDVTYPEGYEGEGLPEFPPIDEGNHGLPEGNTWQPNIYMSEMENYVGTFSDQNFFTFDQVPFLCGEFSPQISIEVWTGHGDDDEVLLDSMTTSASSQFTYTFPTSAMNEDYRIVAWYSCPEYIFTSDPQFYDFTINGMGGLHTLGLETCITETFPWLDMNSCITGMNSILAQLSFNLANPTNNAVLGVATSVAPANCHELGTLGNWIHKEGTTVCPAFSDEVRNTVTPFVTVVVGMMVFFYISRGRGITIE